MIGKLTGLVDSQGADFAIIDVGGVGYVVSCSLRTLAQLPATGEAVSLAVETQMREDAIRLFGFVTAAERDWFRLLQGVQGVGSKVALAILGVLPPTELTLAIARQDRTAVSRAPGVGAKLAARIVAELKDKSVGIDLAAGASAPAAATALPKAAEDAVSALANLGYGRPQAVGAVAEAVAALGPQAATAALIRHGLKLLSA